MEDGNYVKREGVFREGEICDTGFGKNGGKRMKTLWQSGLKSVENSVENVNNSL